MQNEKAKEWKPGDRVCHEQFGDGIIVGSAEHVQPDTFYVDFDSHEPKRTHVNRSWMRLLEPAPPQPEREEKAECEHAGCGNFRECERCGECVSCFCSVRHYCDMRAAGTMLRTTEAQRRISARRAANPPAPAAPVGVKEDRKHWDCELYTGTARWIPLDQRIAAARAEMDTSTSARKARLERKFGPRSCDEWPGGDERNEP